METALAKGAAKPRAMDVSEFSYIPIKQLSPCLFNPRKHFKAADLKEMAESISEQGVLQPLLVRMVSLNAYEVIAGERRYKAAIIAKLKEIPCRVRALTDGQALQIMLVENLQRRDLSPLEEAEGFAALIKLAGADIQKLAKEIGKSLSYLYQRVKLIELIAPAKKLLEAGTISAGHAILIARLTPQIQEEIVTKHLKQGSPYGLEEEIVSVRQLSKFIKDKVLLNLHSAPFDKKATDLLPAAGSCTNCPKRVGHQPELWDSDDLQIKEKDTCSDVVCFRAKNDAWVDYQVKAYKAKGQKLYKVSLGYNGSEQPADVIPTSAWKLAQKPPKGFYSAGAGPCQKAVAGIIASSQAYDLPQGTIVKVCVDPKCPKHWGASKPVAQSNYANDKYHQEQLAKQKQLKAQAAARSKTLDLIIGKVAAWAEQSAKLKVPGTIKIAVAMQDHELAVLADHLVRTAGYDIYAVLSKRHADDAEWNIPTKKKEGGAPSTYALRDWLQKVIPKWKPAQVWKLVMEMVLVPVVGAPGYESGGGAWRDQVLALAAKGYGVKPVKPAPVTAKPKAKTSKKAA